MTITKACVDCKREIELRVPESEWAAYQNGELIQRAMPSVSEDLRELLISGVCGECFDALFAGEDED